jgi:hypothetical protein
VVPSTGSAFTPVQKFLAGQVGCHKACYFVDVTGDGRADFVAHDNTGIFVLAAQ